MLRIDVRVAVGMQTASAWPVREAGAAGRGLDADCSDSQGEGQAASHHQGCYTQEAATRGGQDVSVARADRRSDIDMLAAGDMGSTTGADKQKSDG